MNRVLKRIVASAVVLALASQCFFAYGADAKGDANRDGQISLADARKVLQLASLIDEATPEDIVASDMDGDGILTVHDAKKIVFQSVDISEIQMLSHITQKTPSKKYGSNEKIKYIKVKDLCAETLPASSMDNKSNPLYSALPKGTLDMVKSGPYTDADSGNDFYILKSGRRVYSNEVKAFNGYKLPYNKISLVPFSETSVSETKIYLALDWRVPFNAVVKPQKYKTGYDGRGFNIDGGFTGDKIDITFSYTTAASGDLDFQESGVIKSAKWIINKEEKTATLRIYLNKVGEFGGYTAYYDSNNYLVISFKEPVSSLAGRVIEIDPGHGGAQPGAGSGTGVFERDITYKIANHLKKYLEKAGATVVFSRDDSESVPEIEERRLNTIKNNPDMLVSIHLDSSSNQSAKGCSVYYYKSYSGELAESITKNLSAVVTNKTGYQFVDRGSHFYPFKVIRVENCPAVLVECGFISNSSDFKIQKSASGQQVIARGIYEGICEFWGV